jgi:hypothetical protein
MERACLPQALTAPSKHGGHHPHLIPRFVYPSFNTRNVYLRARDYVPVIVQSMPLERLPTFRMGSQRAFRIQSNVAFIVFYLMNVKSWPP